MNTLQISQKSEFRNIVSQHMFLKIITLNMINKIQFLAGEAGSKFHL